MKWKMFFSHTSRRMGSSVCGVFISPAWSAWLGVAPICVNRKSQNNGRYIAKIIKFFLLFAVAKLST